MVGFVAFLSSSLFLVDPALAFKCGKGGGPYGAEVTRGQDLTGKDFSGKSLIKQDFKTANLNNANLEGATLTGNTSFKGSNITGAAHFAKVHKVFGASNASKLLSYLPASSRPSKRSAAASISYEALARMHDPVYGCVAHILVLQQQVVHLQGEIETLENQMANFGTYQAIANSFSSDELQVFYQPHRMDRQTYLSKETPPPLTSHELNRFANCQMNNMQLPTTYGSLEDQKCIHWPNPSTRDRFSEGINQGIFGSYPWM